MPFELPTDAELNEYCREHHDWTCRKDCTTCAYRRECALGQTYDDDERY